MNSSDCRIRIATCQVQQECLQRLERRMIDIDGPLFRRGTVRYGLSSSGYRQEQLQASLRMSGRFNRFSRDRKRYREVLRRLAMPQNMSAAETCYDNAFMERRHAKKTELVEYALASEAREKAAYIQYHNAGRRHTALGYVSPAEFKHHLAVPKQ